MLFGPSCKKGSSSNADGEFKGTIVVMACGTAVINIDGAVGTTGGATWVASSTVTYNNAATVSNYCYLAAQGVKTGDVITFKVSGQALSPETSCIVPQCLVAGPGNKVYLSDVQKK